MVALAAAALVVVEQRRVLEYRDRETVAAQVRLVVMAVVVGAVQVVLE